MWLEQLASSVARLMRTLPVRATRTRFSAAATGVGPRPIRSRPLPEIARAFQQGVAEGLRDAVVGVCKDHGLNVAVLSGGVFQNEVTLGGCARPVRGQTHRGWTNHAVPPNDGGISLGQAAIAAFSQLRSDA